MHCVPPGQRAESATADGNTPVTDGTADDPDSSTYSIAVVSMTGLETPSSSVIVMLARPAPSSIAGAPGGIVWLAGGKVAVIWVPAELMVNEPGPMEVVPMPAHETSGAPSELKPVPVMTTEVCDAALPALESAGGDTPLTVGGASCGP